MSDRIGGTLTIGGKIFTDLALRGIAEAIHTDARIHPVEVMMDMAKASQGNEPYTVDLTEINGGRLPAIEQAVEETGLDMLWRHGRGAACEPHILGRRGGRRVECVATLEGVPLLTVADLTVEARIRDARWLDTFKPAPLTLVGSLEDRARTIGTYEVDAEVVYRRQARSTVLALSEDDARRACAKAGTLSPDTYGPVTNMTVERVVDVRRKRPAT